MKSSICLTMASTLRVNSSASCNEVVMGYITFTLDFLKHLAHDGDEHLVALLLDGVFHFVELGHDLHEAAGLVFHLFRFGIGLGFGLGGG
jgi:hypothetical protein